jgi:hypothetical protein
MKEVQLVTLVQTSLTTRGDGESTPIRRVMQWWTQEGELVAENDPCSVIVTEEKRREIHRLFNAAGLSLDTYGFLIENVAKILSSK